MHLWKMSITRNKKQLKKSMLNLLINCISLRSASQMLSLKSEYTFHFLNFVIIGLCNSAANPWFGIFSFLTVPSEPDLSGVAKVSDRTVSDRESKADN